MADTERKADDANRVADELERAKKSQDELKQRLLAKELNGELAAAEKDVKDTRDELAKLEHELQKGDLSEAEKARLAKEADALAKQADEAEKRKNALEKRVRDAEAKPAGRGLDELELAAKATHALKKETGAMVERARGLGGEADKGRKREATEKALTGLGDERRRLSDDLDKRLQALDKERRSLEKVQEALAGSEDHLEQQEATARLRAKLVEVKKEAERVAKEKKRLDGEWKSGVGPLVARAREMDIFELEELKADVEKGVNGVRRLEEDAKGLQG